MTTRMLIDARHREETRVAVVKGNRIEEFDFESAERKQLKGNVYLAKVTRVEPSLQAAFVDYGGNRHGFLAFSEIHPDYYQIPKEDRDALLAEEAEHAAEEAALRAEVDEDEGGDVELLERPSEDDEAKAEAEGADTPARVNKKGKSKENDDSAVQALRDRRMSLRKRYKIQDVIRRRQVLLVQVVKEERGNKGAALTSYLSLAGRYCVLMPNTAHGGGISRKISSAADRKRLKTIMAELKLPPTMGCIVRTAGLQRTKTEIKRDFDYLARLWDGIREATLEATAPSLVYGDSDLVKRAIRDIYNRDISEVIVEGEEGYRHAKDFMKLLMPSHARRVKQYADPVPLFQRNHVEDQLGAMYNPVVQLKSGGYLVINPTEALVSIDINSGRSTREHNIEQTATATNLEAAHEIARQLRLRDMAGLVVIDFIDMDHGSNVRKVEKAMKESLKNDRARIQVGRISAFGLMEMSRQRLRTGVLEASTRQCPHCEGTGLVRTAASSGLSALRLIEDEAARGKGSQLLLRASQEAALYVLNNKRAEISEIEERYGVTVEIASDGEIEGARMAVESSGPPPAHAPRIDPIVETDDDDDTVVEEEAADETESQDESRDEDGGNGGRRRRRRRGRRGRGRDSDQQQPTEDEAKAAPESDDEESASENDDDAKPKRRRRGRRGGKRSGGANTAESVSDDAMSGDRSEADSNTAPATEAAAPAEEKPKRTRRRAKPDSDRADTPAKADGPEIPDTAEAPAEPAKPKRTRRKKAAPTEAAEQPADSATEAETEGEAQAGTDETTPAKPKRSRRKSPAKAATDSANDDVSEKSRTSGNGSNDDSAPSSTEAPKPADQQSDAGNDTAPRRGWWQRTFGG